METIIESLKANVDAMLFIQKQQVLRDKYKENAKKWRELNPDKHKQYHNQKNREYYHRNKSVLNKKRVEYYRKKKEREVLEDEQALVAWKLAQEEEKKEKEAVTV
jgi:hypothetical protein